MTRAHTQREVKRQRRSEEAISATQLSSKSNERKKVGDMEMWSRAVRHRVVGEVERACRCGVDNKTIVAGDLLLQILHPWTIDHLHVPVVMIPLDDQVHEYDADTTGTSFVCSKGQQGFSSCLCPRNKELWIMIVLRSQSTASHVVLESTACLFAEGNYFWSMETDMELA
nr:hypothetical protein CFP56_25772 [Quercus suber]